eukprot:scaffold30374_cov107-Isochrysis_galbana.AAC.10
MCADVEWPSFPVDSENSVSNRSAEACEHIKAGLVEWLIKARCLPNELRPPLAVARPHISARCVENVAGAAEPVRPRTWAFRVRSWAFPRSLLCSQATTSLAKPAIPAVGSVCPKLALTEPQNRLAPMASQPAETSVGSPSAVPVPCASSTTKSPARSPAALNARSRRSRWAEPLGAVRLALRPSCRTAVAHIDARADEAGAKATAAHPSLRTYPLACASKVLQRPFALSMPALAYASGTAGASITFAEATSAGIGVIELATCTATSDEEQAVSMLMHVPCKPRTYESRPEAMDMAAPVPAYTESLPVSRDWKSKCVTATYTAMSSPVTDGRAWKSAW